MPNGTYGGVRGTETKVGQRTFVSRPTRLCSVKKYCYFTMSLATLALVAVDTFTR